VTIYTRTYADISPCGKYRYLLERDWDNQYGNGAMFIMLNPSTADGEVDDPTIRRCVGFAKSWGYSSLSVVNLFAYRATDPKDLFKAADVHGPRNQEVIYDTSRRARIIICAWGAHGAWGEQDETVRGWLHNRELYALGFTKHGHPKHPLYLPADAKPIPMPAGAYA
jgi:hypothetical protein